MKNTYPSKKNTKKKISKKFNGELFQKLLEENKDQMIDHVFSKAVELALISKYGSGLLVQPLVSDPDNISDMIKAMSPLKSVIAYEATASFARVLEGILSKTELKDWFYSKTASNLGKKGGRQEGFKSPHIVWLENKMNFIIERNSNLLKPFTAKEHFRELKSCVEINGEDSDGNLTFTEQALLDFGYPDPEPVITINAVTEAFTRINKNTQNNH